MKITRKVKISLEDSKVEEDCVFSINEEDFTKGPLLNDLIVSAMLKGLVPDKKENFSSCFLYYGDSDEEELKKFTYKTLWEGIPGMTFFQILAKVIDKNLKYHIARSALFLYFFLWAIFIPILYVSLDGHKEAVMAMVRLNGILLVVVILAWLITMCSSIVKWLGTKVQKRTIYILGVLSAVLGITIVSSLLVWGVILARSLIGAT